MGKVDFLPKIKNRVVKGLISFNDWLKTYQYLINLCGISLIGLLIAILTFKENADSAALEKTRYQNSLIPVWDVKLNYHENNLDLLSADFTPLNENIKLQKVKLEYLNESNVIVTTEDLDQRLKMNSLAGALVKIFWSYYDPPGKLLDSFDDPSILNFRNCYPIALNFNYIINGEVHEISCLYKLHFQVLKTDRIRIRGLEFYKMLWNDEESAIRKELENLNCSACVGQEICTEEELLANLVRSKSQYKVIEALTLLISHEHTIVQMIENERGVELKTNYHTMPSIAARQDENDKFKSLINQAIQLKGSYDSVTIEQLNHLVLLVERNPFCGEFKVECLIKTSWNNEQLNAEWKEIADKMRLNMLAVSKELGVH